MTIKKKRDIYEETLTVNEAIRYFYNNLAEVSALQLVFPVVVVLVFHSSVSTGLLFVWFALTISVYLGRIVLTGYYQKINPPPEKAPVWGWYLTLTTFLSGLLWGFAAFNFHDPDQIYYHVLLYVIVVGFAAGSLMLTTYWLPAFYAYVFPALGGVILDLIMHDVPQRYYLTFLLFIFLLMLIRVARGNHKTAYDAIRLQQQNLELIKQLEAEKEKAEAASHAKTRFLASANHDLRQPVHALSLLIHGLRKELTTAQGKLLFLRLERSVNNLGNLLESLLDLSRLDAAAIQLTPVHFPVSAVSTQLLAEYLPVAREKGLRFSVRLCDAVLHTDRTLFERLLRNLLNNAFRYTHQGGVLVGFRKRGERLSIEVWDTGIGIPEMETRKIFSEFYQSENLERDRSKGLGLGLSICQRIATLLETEIKLVSRVGKGSVFRFELPLANSPLFIQNQTVHLTCDHAELAGRTLLIIDDDMEVLQAMIQLVRNWNMNPVTARDSAEAFELLGDSNRYPDAIICDHRLSKDETGLDAIKQIQQRYAIPALMITGDTAPENLQAIENSGFPVLHKPVLPEKLLQTLIDLLKPA